MTDFQALCAELADSIELLLEMRPVEAKPLQITEDRLARARAALAEPELRPTENNSAELAADIRRFLHGYQQMRGLDPENIYSIHRGDALEAHLRVSQLARIAEILEAQ